MESNPGYLKNIFYFARMGVAREFERGLLIKSSASKLTEIWSLAPPALFPHEEVVLCFRRRPLTTIDLDTKPALSENIRKLEPPGGHKCIIGLHKLCFDEISSLLDFELKISWKIILSQQILKP